MIKCWIRIASFQVDQKGQKHWVFTWSDTGKSLSEARIFASTNPQYNDRLFIVLQVQYMKIPTLGGHVVYRNCFWHLEQFLYTCSPHVLQKEKLLTKIYLYEFRDGYNYIYQGYETRDASWFLWCSEEMYLPISR